jgi:hypothetical protein
MEHHRVEGRRGLMGTVVDRYGGEEYVAVDVRLADGQLRLFWPRDLEEISPLRHGGAPFLMAKVGAREMEQLLLPKFDYYLDQSDPDIVILRRQDGSFVAAFSADGTGVVKLTDSQSFNGDAGWSPDGRRIAFESDRANLPGRNEIHVMDANGSNVRRVTTLPADAMFDLAPRFSPDGRRLVFTRYITDPGVDEAHHPDWESVR